MQTSGTCTLTFSEGWNILIEAYPEFFTYLQKQEAKNYQPLYGKISPAV
ncbi:hypothetical protein [Nostoc sp. UHCC 0251]|nr:hypothetical protein [Nostoc sp. UHCC 0251]MEA5624966.1 hypothetical protein [Nostoc sp. UHCC 0251]